MMIATHGSGVERVLGHLRHSSNPCVRVCLWLSDLAQHIL
jgi:hypothetical protein